MATLISAIETQARRHLIETTASFWTSAELVDIIAKGCLDLWRPIVDLKQEYYLTVDPTHVTMEANATTLTGVPPNVHKVYLIEPLDNGSNGANQGLHFDPLDYNDPKFRAARASASTDPSNGVIYYAVTGQGAPVAAPVIYVAPTVSSRLTLRFCYVPVLAVSDLTAENPVPIPGEADNALIAWTVAFARAKEREDRSPDPEWLTIYGTEKQNLLQSLGLRQLQEPEFVKGTFEDLW